MTHPLIDSFKGAGQAQVFAYFDQLSPDEQRQLLEQAGEIDLAEIDRLSRTLLGKNAAEINLEGLAPAPYEKRPEHGGEADAWVKAKAAGEEALRAGRVAAFMVAGGQGTRLGYDGPKGTFPVTPVKRKPLFQVFAEKIRAAGLRYGQPLHWFIMTSHANHAATEAFFAEHGFFGLERGRVHFFRQRRMPAVNFEGRIMLESKSAIALSPDGHGGSLRALERSGSLDLMQREGIDTLSYFQVDNPLVRCVDPEFIGWHLMRRSDMSSKMVPKAYAEEKVGHFCVQSGKLVVVEYSDLPMAMQRETDAQGQLRYLAGSIAIHILDREFVRRMARSAGSGKAHSAGSLLRQGSGGQGGRAETNESAKSGEDVALPFHRADKKIPTIDASGRPVKPDRANGVKFEMFVFDALPFARNPVVIETRREDDFSPVKNAEGVDSPKTCRDDQLRQFGRWLTANGTGVATDATGLPALTLEVSPLFGYDEDSFAESWKKLSPKPVIHEGLYLE
ncbi:MAG: UDPGP type 1 family protein [Opitutaceae bacterium]|nr:UDPGP type 1 family protein [Opitutaceae bacterium]